jgi:Na+-driven multidrug efflux pump
VGRTAGIAIMVAAMVGAGILALREPILGLYNVSDEVIFLARNVMLIQALSMIVRSLNNIFIIGMMRSGGDTRYSLFLDGIIIWILGVPMAFLGGFVLHLPVYWVYLFVMSEELTKCILGIRRYFSRKWIHDLTRMVDVGPRIEPAASEVETAG